jgi:hypothetical protein
MSPRTALRILAVVLIGAGILLALRLLLGADVLVGMLRIGTTH